jgi:hypothetical protein
LFTNRQSATVAYCFLAHLNLCWLQIISVENSCEFGFTHGNALQLFSIKSKERNMEPKEREKYRSLLANHPTLLAVVILLAGSLYLYFGNATTMLVGGELSCFWRILL